MLTSPKTHSTMPIQTTYAEVRDRMQPGDVIAFGGRGLVSWIIQTWTRHPVSHVGIVGRVLERDGRIRVKIYESTMLNGTAQVADQYLSDVIERANGNVWWLPLSLQVRAELDMVAFWTSIDAMNGTRYDLFGAAKSAMWTIQPKEDRAKLFCSEFVAAALEDGGAIHSINCSEVDPRECVGLRIYSPVYYQLKGKPTRIKNHNSINPEGFGE